jgi:hypothetical protein
MEVFSAFSIERDCSAVNFLVRELFSGVDENLGLMLVMTRQHCQGSTLLLPDIYTVWPMPNAC